MKRRSFNAATAMAALTPVVARAQAAFEEGKNYVKLEQPVATGSPGKVEVIEFFWYGCPHCNALEPMLEAWAKKLPADVVFRRVPVAFRKAPFEAHQKIYYALEALGQVEAAHRKVFYAIHNDRLPMTEAADIAAYLARQGVDGKKFLDAFNSFSVATKAGQATALSRQYKIDGVPALGVQGRYWTSASLAGSQERMLAATDYLIRLARGKS